MKEKELEETLETILDLIRRDTNKIASNFVDIQLDPQTAQSLCRFATTLANIKDNRKKEEDKTKADLNKLSTEELIAMYKDTTK